MCTPSNSIAASLLSQFWCCLFTNKSRWWLDWAFTCKVKLMRHCLAAWKCGKSLPRKVLPDMTNALADLILKKLRFSHLHIVIWGLRKQTRIQYMWKMSISGVKLLFIVQEYVVLLLILLWMALYFQTGPFSRMALYFRTEGIFIYWFIYTFVYLSIHSFILLFIYLYEFTYSFIYLFIYLFICLFVHLFFLFVIYLLIHAFIYLFVCLFIYLSVYVLIYLSVYITYLFDCLLTYRRKTWYNYMVN